MKKVYKGLLTILLVVPAFFYHSSAQVVLPPDILCVQNNASNGDITINWANVPNGCGPFVQDTIYASSVGPNGPFDSIIIITSSTATSYTFTNWLAISQHWWFYMVADFNCPGYTFQASDTVENGAPSTPQIVNVTVTPNNQVIFNWLPSSSPQTVYYVLYYYLPNGQGTAFDTVYGRGNTTIIDSLKNPSNQELYYTVAAFDSCGNASAFYTPAHHTILSSASVTACEVQVNITWSHYDSWPQGVLGYYVWISKNGGPFTIVAAADSSGSSFAYTNFATGDSLIITVEALSAADTTVTSYSNYVYMQAFIDEPPSYIYLTNVSVTLNNAVTMTWTIDTTAELVFYHILQSIDSDTASFASVGQLPIPQPLQHFETWIDSNYIFPQNNPYFYKIDAFDSCQNQYITPYAETVNLQAQEFDLFRNRLNWNSFVLVYTTVLRYNIYRDMGSGYQLLQTVGAGVNQLDDSIEQLISTTGTFCYRIEAVYFINLPAPSGYQDTLSSFSNVACVVERPIIYVPNAFSPTGVNNVFKPTIIFGNPTAYSMLIFNRWGGKVFESDVVTEGWDGNDHGKAAEMGGYAYLIQFTAADGVKIERQGIVMLVR